MQTARHRLVEMQGCKAHFWRIRGRSRFAASTSSLEWRSHPWLAYCGVTAPSVTSEAENQPASWGLEFPSGCCSEVCTSRCCFAKKVKFKGEMPRCQSRVNRGSFPEILGWHRHRYSHSPRTGSWTDRYKNNCLVFPKHSPL